MTKKDLRLNKLNISVYDCLDLEAFIIEIEFLLRGEGVDKDRQGDKKEAIRNYYFPMRHNAKAFLKEEKFILVAEVRIRNYWN